MSAIPCPVCDVKNAESSPVVALAIGTALGAAFNGMHRVTELVCEPHRPVWMLAMMRAAIATNAVEGDDELPEAP